MSKVYSIFDDKAQVFNLPFYCSNDAMAIRAFADAINNSGRLESRFPEDFHLYCLGEFNDDKGVFECGNTPVFLANGISLVRLVSPEERVDTVMSGSARGKDM